MKQQGMNCPGKTNYFLSTEGIIAPKTSGFCAIELGSPTSMWSKNHLRDKIAGTCGGMNFCVADKLWDSYEVSTRC